MNDEKVANRIQIAGAEENVYVIPLFNFNDPALVQTYVEGQTMNGIYPYFAYATVTE